MPYNFYELLKEDVVSGAEISSVEFEHAESFSALIRLIEKFAFEDDESVLFEDDESVLFEKDESFKMWLKGFYTKYSDEEINKQTLGLLKKVLPKLISYYVASKNTDRAWDFNTTFPLNGFGSVACLTGAINDFSAKLAEKETLSSIWSEHVKLAAWRYTNVEYLLEANDRHFLVAAQKNARIYHRRRST